jgi:bifunctional non-homologous end joining protein LigD
MARRLPKSKRQYVQNLNTATKELIRTFEKARPGPMPTFIEPLFATLRDKPPSGDNWVHEIKFDGYRFQSHIRYGQEPRFFTRRGHDWTDKIKGIAAAMSSLQPSAIVDGEVVVEAGGTTDFNELERELAKGNSDRLTYFVFDVPYLDGFDLRDETLLHRKRALQVLLQELPEGSPIKFSEHVEGDAVEMKKTLCGMNLEGVVSKLKNGRYVSGRSDVWVKAPCRKRDTFIIVGWVLKGRKFDGFYLGEEHSGELVYAGKIEGGWTEKQKDELLQEVQALETDRSPLVRRVEKPKARWVKPRVLVDVEYRAKTKASGLLRHPSFKGIRRDLMDSVSTRRPRRRAKRSIKPPKGRAK